MKNKRCLGFLVITLALVISMFSNVFASSYGYWTCVDTYNISLGGQLNYMNGLYLESINQQSVYAKFESSFEVSSGDTIELKLSTQLEGDEDYFDQAASMCGAAVIDENGNVILSIYYQIAGSYPNYSETKSANITAENAGKLYVTVSLEGTGTNYVDSCLGSIHLKVNNEYV